MTHDPRTEPLLEWNRLAREKTENAVISSMFEAALKSSNPIESFSNWLLIATGAVASFLLANTDKVFPLITKQGFKVGGILLCISCVFGLVSRIFAVRCRIGADAGNAAKTTFEEHLAKHNAEEEKIQSGARIWGITLETGIRINRVLEEFLAPFPWWVRWLSSRHFKKNASNPQIAYISRIKSLNARGLLRFCKHFALSGSWGLGSSMPHQPNPSFNGTPSGAR